MSLKPRILFIEDDLPSESNGSMIWMILEENGFVVTPARTGKEALSYLQTEGFDLVVLDIMLAPRSDDESHDHRLDNVKRLDMGLFILEILRSGELGNAGTPSNVPVVVISAVAGFERWIRIRNLVGSEEFCLEKPCSVYEQLAAILAALGGKNY